MDPNSQNQLWSEWSFLIHDGGRLVSREDVKENVARWLARLFGTAAAFRLTRTPHGWQIKCRAEGVAAHDPKTVAYVKQQFAAYFVARGWGPIASSSVSVRILAGSEQDGRPPDQWVGIPTIRVGRSV